MKIEEIDIKKDDLGLSFNETEKIKVLEKLLEYIENQNFRYYYFLYYDSLFFNDLSLYYKDYPILEERTTVGCFKIKPEHIDDITFMYKIMNQYHDSSLYVNNDSEFLRFYDLTYRVQEFPDDIGYIIESDTFSGYIHIHKASDLPDWDLAKMDIEVLK